MENFPGSLKYDAEHWATVSQKVEHKRGCLSLLTTVAILSFSMIFENPLAFLDPILNGL